jgi:T-complex protein 1 subunit theta
VRRRPPPCPLAETARRFAPRSAPTPRRAMQGMMMPRMAGGGGGGYVPNQGLAGLLKDGSKHMAGLDEAVLRNIDACKQLSAIVRTSIGPNGMNKMVVNHLGRIFVTSDAATIVRELDVVHPAAKLIVMASQTQEREVGDGTGLVVTLAGELLEQAEKLLRQGLHTSEVIQGFETAGEEALKILDDLVVYKVVDPISVDSVVDALRTCIASKQYGVEDILAPLVAKACVASLPSNINLFSVENVRVAKVLGGTLSDSSVVAGAVIVRDVEGTVKRLEDAKVVVYTCDVEAAQSETKGTVLLKSAEEFTNYTKSEETMLEGKIKAIADAGVNCIVATKFGEVAMHFIEKYRLMAIRCQSKFDLRRVARTTGAVALAKLQTPTPDEAGRADAIAVEEIGSTKCTVFRMGKHGSRIATILLRASTQNLLDDVDRAIDDAVNVYKGITKDPRYVAGGGAAEAEISRRLHLFADTREGLDQYAIKKYATALEVVPRMLAENAGNHPTDVVSNLIAAHASGQATAGVNVDDGSIVDALENRILDQLMVKHWALRLATDAVVTILRVDQIIMAKEAGGPKPRDMMAADAADEAP